MRKLKIVGLSDQDNGVFYYRILNPLRSLADQCLAEIHHMPFFGQNASYLTSKEFREWFALEAKWADIIYTTTPSSRDYLSLILGMKEFGKCKLVMDIDDDILAVPYEPMHPAYQAYMDKEYGYAEYTQIALEKADLITTTTGYLKRKYEPINNKIEIIKNCIPLDIKYRNKEKELTVGFAGSATHQNDWLMIDHIIADLKKKYKFKLKILGPVQTVKAIPDEQIQWVEMLQYHKTLASLGLSIGLAPLKDSLFSRGKSNLRWLEYSRLKIPTVGSDVVPFRDTNMYLCNEPEDWYETLDNLLKSKDLRTKKGKEAHNKMKEEYDARRESTKLLERIRAI